MTNPVLREGLDAAAGVAIRGSERTGRPLGTPAFIRTLEKKLDRTLVKSKPGPKPKTKSGQLDCSGYV